MTASTHQMLGAAVAIYYIQHTGEVGYYPIVFSIAGSLIPDIDEPNSKIGSKVTGLSKTTKSIFGHRTITHSFLGVFIFGMIVKYLTGIFSLPDYITTFFVLGYLSHLLGDMFTISGVPLFYPLRRKYAIPIVKTGGKMERFFQIIIGFVVVYQVGLIFGIDLARFL